MTDPNYNPYAAPSETPAYDFGRPAEDGNYVLATLGQRFAGNMIDGLVFLPAVLVMIPVMAATENSEEKTTVFMVACGLIVLLIAGIQWNMIAKSGQTIGKRAVKTKIVRVDGSNPGFLYGVVMRTWVGHLPNVIPGVGSIYGMLDTVFIFRQDRRTLRDLIAGTRVIQI